MDRLQTALYGGFPFELDDLRFQFNAFLDVLQGIGKGFGDDYIISGCDYTTNEFGIITYVQPGWVSIQGEPCFFPGGSAPTASVPGILFFHLTSTVDPAGEEVFEDGTTQNAYIRRRVALVQLGGLAPQTVNIQGPRIVDLIRTRDTWRTVGAVGQPPFATGWNSPLGPWHPLQFRKELGNLVRLRGVVNAAPGITDLVPFTLPLGYRPERTVFGVISSLSEAEPVNVSVEIGPTGAILINNGNVTGSGATYDLSMLPVFEAV